MTIELFVTCAGAFFLGVLVVFGAASEVILHVNDLREAKAHEYMTQIAALEKELDELKAADPLAEGRILVKKANKRAKEKEHENYA